jgi:hypothetical protein
VLKRLTLSPQDVKQHEFDFGAIDYADLEVRQLGDITKGC